MKLSAVQGRVAPDPARGEDGEREEAAGEGAGTHTQALETGVPHTGTHTQALETGVPHTGTHIQALESGVPHTGTF